MTEKELLKMIFNRYHSLKLFENLGIYEILKTVAFLLLIENDLNSEFSLKIQKKIRSYKDDGAYILEKGEKNDKN